MNPRLWDELDRRFDGPIPPQYLAPPALTRAELVCDQAKITACRRKLALAALAERRRLWAQLCLATQLRLATLGGIRHMAIDVAWQYADHCARREVRMWAEARATLAQYRDEMAGSIGMAR